MANYSDNTVTVIDGVTSNTTTVAVGAEPQSLAVNPVTNKVYVANYIGGTVTVIDGVTSNTTTVAAGANPEYVTVNPATNKIYVANQFSHAVTVIDGPTNSIASISLETFGSRINSVAVNPVTNKVYLATFDYGVMVIDGATNNIATVATDAGPQSLAVNSETNQIFVANSCGIMTVINGANNSTITLPAGSNPYFVDVNPVTNKIYVANNGSNNVTVIDGASDSTSAISANHLPFSVAVNPVTNKIYVANYGTNVTVIDGATNTTVNITAGSNPFSVEVNPVTNKIYVANYYSNNVTVIDGATNTTTTVAAGTSPYAVAVNPVTNKIYVANVNGSDVTVIDGATNSTASITVGTAAPYPVGPYAVAVNPVTNKIYVANSGTGNVAVIDGATNTINTVATGNFPRAISVNPVTNKIYVAKYGDGTVTVIDGATNTTNIVATGASPRGVSVNPVTNKIYVANVDSNNVTVIDGATNTTTTVAAGTSPYAVEVNPVTNNIYVANVGSNNVTVIDGATNRTITVAAGTSPYAMAVNQVTNVVYVTNLSSDTVTAITEAPTQALPLTTAITALTGNQTGNPVSAFTFTATSTTITQPDALYYQFDTWQSSWTAASGSNPTFTGSAATLQPGFHILYAYATDGQEATAASPLTGNIQAYEFLVLPAVVSQVTVGTNILGPAFTVDGTLYTSTQTFAWNAGDSHTISTTSTQTGPPGTQFVFTQWSDGTTSPSETITVPNVATTYTANFLTQYLLTVVANPQGAGTVSPGGYFNAYSVFPITEAPNGSDIFTGWTGGLIASPGSASTTVTMTGPQSMVANFQVLVSQAIAFNSIPPQTVGTPLTLSATATSGLPVSYLSSTPSVCTLSGAAATFLSPGSCTITASQSGDSSFLAAAPVSQTFQVNTATLAAILQSDPSALNFGFAFVCPSGVGPAPCSQSVTLTYSLTDNGSLGTPAVLTDGAPNLDFTLASGTTCTGVVSGGATCSVTVTFAPLFPGPRRGAVQILDGSGNILTTTYIQGVGHAPQVAFGPGPQSTLGSGFNAPGGVAVDGAGNVFVADGGGAVYKLPAGGGAQTTIGSGFKSPFGVAVDSAGNVFVTDNLANSVVEVPANGSAPVTLTSAVLHPTGVTVDGQGNVYVADTGNNRILELPAGGGSPVVVPTSGLAQPLAVALDALGNIYIADYGNGRVIMIGGGQQTTIASGIVPEGLAVDAAGDVYISDTSNNRVLQVPAGGGAPTTALASSGGVTIQPQGLAIDAGGNLFVADASNALITELNRSQAPALSFAATAAGNTSSDSPQSVSVANIGNALLSLSGIAVPTNFAQVPGSGTPVDCTASSLVSPGATCNLSISFKPTGAGSLSGALVLTDNSLNGYAVNQSIALVGHSLAAQTITFPAIGTQTIGAHPTLTASASSGLGVIYTTLTPPVCTVSGSTATLVAPGTCGITASQPGNGIYAAAAPVTISFTVLSNAPPTVVSLTPSSGTGKTQTFAAVYSDANGGAYLNAVYLLFNTAVTSSNGCYVQYYPSSNLLYLKNDAGTALSAGVVPGSAAQVSNSQCTLSGAGSSYAVSANTATLKAALTFNGTAPFNAYLDASDRSSNTSGWIQKGGWTPVTAMPSVVSLTPSSGSGKTQTFAAVFSDQAGGSYLNAAYVLFNSSVSSVNGCYVLYYPSTNLAYLKNDAGTANSIGITPGSAAQVSNSQCTLSGTGSSYTISGNSATLTLAIAFSGTATSNVHLYAADKGGNNTGFVQKGTWAPVAAVPSVVSVTPNSGIGLTQTFKGVYSDTLGASGLNAVYMLFNSTLSSVQGCYVSYNPISNLLFLKNAPGTANYPGIAPGATVQLTNGYCTLSAAESSYAVSGNTATLNLAITFLQSSSANIYMLSSEKNGSNSGWVLKGTWVP